MAPYPDQSERASGSLITEGYEKLRVTSYKFIRNDLRVMNHQLRIAERRWGFKKLDKDGGNYLMVINPFDSPV
jgi:hypothetical protein